MTQEVIIKMLLTQFYENFATQMPQTILQHSAMEQIYTLATAKFDKWGLSGDQIDKIVFRAAYTLETIYFNDRKEFDPFIARFMADFARTENGSARRHFTKMMVDLLNGQHSSKPHTQDIAQAAAMWIVEPSTKVAVQVWAMEILFLLRQELDWLPGALADIMELLARDPSPAINSRIKKWKNRPLN